jgi:hypothetical protein
MVKCAYKRRDGSPCGGVATGIHGGCFQHDPSFELDRKRAAKRNQKSKAANPGTADLARLQHVLEGLAGAVLKGSVDKSQAAVACQLLTAARGCIVAAAKLRELETVEERIEALEQALSKRSG